ncbi:MAG: hypothetical protein WBH97_09535 [Rectinemataceae bacterium]
MSARLRFSIILLSLTVAFAAATPGPSAPGQGTLEGYSGWKVRYGVAAAPDKLAALINRTESFAVDAIKSKDEASGENRVFGTGEAHGVFAVPLEAAAAVAVDYPNLKAISPRVKEVRVLESGDGRWLAYEDLGIDFLGISMGYRLDVETLLDRFPGGAIGVRSRLVKSHDGKLYASDSSWYFAPVIVGGKEYTYIRVWTTSGLRNPAAGVAGILKLFTSGELRDQVSALAKIAGTSAGAAPKP